MTILFIDDYDCGWNVGIYVLDITNGVCREIEEPYRKEILETYKQYDLYSNRYENIIDLARFKFFDGILISEDGENKVFRMFDR